MEQSTMYLPLLVKKCAYVHRSIYVLALLISPLFHRFVFSE